MAGQVELPLTHVMGVCVKTPAVSKTIGYIYIYIIDYRAALVQNRISCLTVLCFSPIVG